MLGAKTLELLALELGDLLALGKRFRHGLTMEFGERWLVVEGFEVGHTAGHVQPDDPFGLGFEMQGIDCALPIHFLGAGNIFCKRMIGQ